ncbi:phosphoenolpyruvate carboxykinase, partial [bacterium]|nr:phosphoenolpyruvate carboxykinase [bacterium]
QNLYLFVEALYNYWREFERFVVCDSEGDGLDKRPYRTFNDTVEKLINLVRGSYRDIQENITGKHPIIYRQVSAGAEISSIALPKKMDLPQKDRSKLDGIPFIRQILLYPPLLLNPPMNKRTGAFQRVDQNPLELVNLDTSEWLCYPARVGAQLILVYFHEKFFELGFSLSNLFELADDEALKQKPDAVFLYGVPGNKIDGMAELPTVFFDDEENDLLIGAIPARNEFGYFGYLKKMILTLHNIKTMKQGKMPYHGAMVQILLKNNKSATILIIGDTGTGKSETLEAFKTLSAEKVREIVIIADDMGSLAQDADGNIVGFGTETGAFVRLDDLQPGYAFGQLDRTIIMNPSQQNARVILPVTTYENIVKGFPVDYVLYANNYEKVDESHAIIERLDSSENALSIFRDGAAMSKGTTTSTGLVHTYFVNVFGAMQYREKHDKIARQFFEAFYKNKIFVGQLRTQLGIPGWERRGPEATANALLEMIENQ